MNKYLYVSFCVILAGCSIKLSDTERNALTSQINAMVETDQIAASHWEEEWQSYKDSVFTEHKRISELIFDQYGFPGYNLVGEEASNNFWLVVQHCDKFPEFQTRVLADMDIEVKKKNANPNNYAYLFDRVAVNTGGKQLFGTQLDYDVNTTGRAFPKNGLVDSINVDHRRTEYGLGPLKEYLNMMTTMHYQMNEERYREMGIMEPMLYEE